MEDGGGIFEKVGKMFRPQPQTAEFNNTTIKNSEEQVDQYALDSDHTAIPSLSDELSDRLSEATLSVINSIEMVPKKDISELVSQISKTKVLQNISQAQFEKELDRFLNESIAQRAFDKPLNYPENARGILSRLGLIFDNPYAVIYAFGYILAMGKIQTQKKNDRKKRS